VLGHGASGNAASMRPYVDELGRLGVEAVAIDLPLGNAERAVQRFLDLAAPGETVVVGGHSYGGRVASMAAAQSAFAAGLVLLSYPLHRPGHPEELRTAHWAQLRCPVLLLSGESDPFARVDLLRSAVATLPRARLVTYPRVGHGLVSVAGDVCAHIAAFVQGLS